MSAIIVAAVQAGSPLFDTTAAMAKAEALIRGAAADGARLIVLPEAYVGGYPKGLDFGITVGSRSADGRDQFRRYFESAIAVPGP
jgi:nitrilase